MAGVKGRHEARKRVCHRANTFQRAAPEFHDRVSGQQHVGTQPWGLPVLGPCQWHRPYRARSRSNRATTKAHEGPRVRSTVPPRRGPMTGGGRMARSTRDGGQRRWRWRRTRRGRGEGDDARPRRSRVFAKCHPIPVGLPRRFSAS